MSTSCCPFCRHPIPPEVNQWGGSCPSCLATIHGEESATDPGVGQLVAAEAERARRANRRVLVATLVGSSALCLGVIPMVGALVLGTPDAGQQRLDLGNDTLTQFDYEWATDAESIHAELDKTEAEPRDTGAPERVHKAVAVPWGVGEVEVADVDLDARAVDAQKRDGSPGSRKSRAVGDATIEDIADLSTVEGTALEIEFDAFADQRAELDRQRQEDAALARMSISDRLARGSTFDRAAGRCLAKTPASGAFAATFVVGTDGVLRDVVVEANGGERNERMERCLAGAISGYKTGAKLDAPQSGRYDFWF